jgi:hypothetical protein
MRNRETQESRKCGTWRQSCVTMRTMERYKGEPAQEGPFPQATTPSIPHRTPRFLSSWWAAHPMGWPSSAELALRPMREPIAVRHHPLQVSLREAFRAPPPSPCSSSAPSCPLPRGPRWCSVAQVSAGWVRDHHWRRGRRHQSSLVSLTDIHRQPALFFHATFLASSAGTVRHALMGRYPCVRRRDDSYGI